MDKKEIKRRLHERCLDLHMTKVKRLETAVEEAENSANDYGPQSDIYDSQKMQMIIDRDMYASQLQNEMSLLETLYKIDPLITNTKVEFGCVVETDSQKLYVAIGLGKVTIDAGEFYVISTKVPIYDAIKGKQKGDTFEFRGIQQIIRDIY